MPRRERPDPDEECPNCGHTWDNHDVDQHTGEQSKCPVVREESHTPPQEHRRSPRGDY